MSMPYNVDENSLKEIYNFSPAFNNLYTLELFDLSYKKDTNISKVFRYHSPRVDFDGESLMMKRNEITKRFQLESSPYRRADSISVTLREDEQWSVKRYHENWLAKFYDKKGDHFISYYTSDHSTPVELFRKLRIYLPNSEDCIVMTILPSNTGGMTLGWGSGDIITHQITYNVESWNWELVE